MLEAAPVAVRVRDVHKTFRLPHQQYHTLKERALHPLRTRTYDELRALRDVNVEIKRGEFFGIVGRNGSGKSTLLKVLAGIYRPDKGKADVAGRISPFIELGVGFNPDLTARENVVINGVMMGLSRREAKRAFDEIIEFAELEDFVDMKLKNYSSGMAVRLGFATAIQVESDVLLIDEVLAVGDAAFQQKCFDEFHRLRRERRTIVFVTHDMGATERFCDRAMLLDRGRIVDINTPQVVARSYNEMNFGRLAVTSGDDTGRSGDQTVCEILDAWVEHEGERVAQVAQNEVIDLVMRVRFHQVVEEPSFGVTLRNEVRHTLFTTSTEWAQQPTGTFQRGDEVVYRVTLKAWFGPSLYTLTPAVTQAGSGANALDMREDLTSLLVHTTRASGSIAQIPHTMSVER